MRSAPYLATLLLAVAAKGQAPPPFPADPDQAQERTCFQTDRAWNPYNNLRSDVVLAYGIDKGLPERIGTWRDRGYRIHVMTGVSWGQYQDYLYGRFDGVNHEDNAQTDRNGNKISHGGDVYYMCPAENFGTYLCVGVQRALDAGAEAIHLEEPEFWARAGYSEGFKREWKAYFKEDWQPPHESVDAQWKASKLKYYLYRRALQQVFDHVQKFNREKGKQVRCYVPTHSLINYAHWKIVSPQSSLAKLDGCNGYIAQVWTGTSRTPNVYRGERRERTFETAFLEYGAMQNLVRATGRTVWYLNDPIEDNPRHDWTDYRTNWESTMVASLLQPDVWQYEVAPWPDRIFHPAQSKYPRGAKPEDQKTIPPEYATELQVVMNALNDMKQPDYAWDCGTRGIGVLISDSLMFQREGTTPSDAAMSHFYGQALPLLKRGIPVTPVQLENVMLPGFLKDLKVLVLSYEGQKPQSPEVHPPLAEWVKQGGVLVVTDEDGDPYNRVKEWWNENGKTETNPRQDLFRTLGLKDADFPEAGSPRVAVGKGEVVWLRLSPVTFCRSVEEEAAYVRTLRASLEKTGGTWQETNHLLLRRGPYFVAAGLDESVELPPKLLKGRFVNLFDPALKVQREVELKAGTRCFLLDLDRVPGERLLASACKALPRETSSPAAKEWTVEGIEGTPAAVLIGSSRKPKAVTLEGQPLGSAEYSEADKLLHVKFPNTAGPRVLRVEFE